MASEEFDPFKLSSGLPLSGAEVTVEKVEFGYDNEYSADALVAMITFVPDEGETPTRPQIYSMGANFEAVDRGERVQHKSGKQANFNDNSTWGKFITAFTTMEGAAEAMKETRERDSSPFEASWLVGMRFKLGDLTYSAFAGKGNPLKEKTLIVPVEYLGTANGAAAKPAAKSGGKLAPKAGKAAPKKEEEAAADDFGIDDEDTRNAIIALAAEHTDFGDFAEAALDVDGVGENAAWRKAVMSSKAGSIWAVHGGS